jgi:hypothetical protein
LIVIQANSLLVLARSPVAEEIRPATLPGVRPGSVFARIYDRIFRSWGAKFLARV